MTEPIRHRQRGCRLDGLAQRGVPPATGEVQTAARRQRSVNRLRIRGAALGCLQRFLQLLEGGTVGLRRSLLKNLQQCEQFLRPELLITPEAERFLLAVQLGPLLIGDRAGDHLIRGNHVLAGIAAEEAGGTDHAAWAELANGGETTVVTTHQTGLTLQQHQNPGRDVIRLAQLLTQLEAQQLGGVLQLRQSGIGHALEGGMLEKRKGRGLGHQEMLKSLNSPSSRLKVVAVSSAIQASNISRHIRSETSGVNVAGE